MQKLKSDVHAYKNTYMNPCIHICMHACMHVHTHILTHIHSTCIPTYLHTFIHTYIHTYVYRWTDGQTHRPTDRQTDISAQRQHRLRHSLFWGEDLRFRQVSGLRVHLDFLAQISCFVARAPKLAKQNSQNIRQMQKQLRDSRPCCFQTKLCASPLRHGILRIFTKPCSIQYRACIQPFGTPRTSKFAQCFLILFVPRLPEGLNFMSKEGLGFRVKAYELRHDPLKEKLTGLDAGEQLGAAWLKLDVATTTNNNS